MTDQIYLDTLDCTACGLVAGLHVSKLWPNKAKGGVMIEWKCSGKGCMVRIYEQYDGASEAPSSANSGLVVGAGRFVAGRNASEIENSIDPKNAPSLASPVNTSILDAGCELCHEKGGTLIFMEGIWICKSCKSVCEDGEYHLSQLKR